jgi:hypothetical protein
MKPASSRPAAIFGLICVNLCRKIPEKADFGSFHDTLQPVTALFFNERSIIFCHRHAGAPPAAPGSSENPTPDGAEATEEFHG